MGFGMTDSYLTNCVIVNSYLAASDYISFPFPPQKTSHNSRTYLEVCDREYLFEEEVEAMVKTARKGCYCLPWRTFFLWATSENFLDNWPWQLALSFNLLPMPPFPRVARGKVRGRARGRERARGTGRAWGTGRARGTGASNNLLQVFFTQFDYLSRQTLYSEMGDGIVRLGHQIFLSHEFFLYYTTFLKAKP